MLKCGIFKIDGFVLGNKEELHFVAPQAKQQEVYVIDI